MPAALRTGFCFGAICLASCVTPEVRGKYQLPHSDVAQIQHVLLWTIGIPKPVSQISGDDPAHAHALTGEGFIYLVRLEKKDGVWRILSKELFMVTGS